VRNRFLRENHRHEADSGGDGSNAAHRRLQEAHPDQPPDAHEPSGKPRSRGEPCPDFPRATHCRRSWLTPSFALRVLYGLLVRATGATSSFGDTIVLWPINLSD